MADAKIVLEAIEESRRWENRCSVISKDMEAARLKGNKETIQMLRDDLSHAQEQLAYYRSLLKDMKGEVSEEGLGDMMDGLNR
ncbi:MAG: hypothetical protein KAT70_04625 [Thermoplasmata archaeon]|nr:hypothetical protein [Thermoplasmata archaeon]